VNAVIRAQSTPYGDALQAAAYSREGKLRHIAKCPISFNPGIMGRPAMIDARGTTYFAVYQYGKGERGVFRAPPEGRAGPWLMPQSEGGVLGDENAFALGPDGTIVALGRSGQMRVFGPDARVVFLSPACERHDSGQTVVPTAKLAPDIEAQIKEEVAKGRLMDAVRLYVRATNCSAGEALDAIKHMKRG